MSEVLEKPVSPQRGWEYLKAMEYRLRIPRPENKQADPIEQEAWKKTAFKSSRIAREISRV